MSRQSVYVSSGPSSLRGRTRNRKSRRHGRHPKVKAQQGVVGRAAHKLKVLSYHTVIVDTLFTSRSRLLLLLSTFIHTIGEGC
jgi:hypothetical protein